MTPIKFDYYESACTFIEVLKTEILFTEASELQKAIDDGSTANEITMALRWNLQKIIARDLAWSNTTQRRATSLLDGLNEMLK